MKQTLASALLSAALLACTGVSGHEPPRRTPIDGLAFFSARDSAGSPIAVNPSPSEPGRFHGTVRGQFHATDPGQDTLQASPRLAGVAINVYPLLSMTDPGYNVGPVAASLVTDGSGDFQTAELPGGTYLVTFSAPPSGPYNGVWTTVALNSKSNDTKWWVILPARE